MPAKGHEPVEPDEGPQTDRVVASEDPLNRNVPKRYDTPRQYEKKEDEDPVMPGDDATLKTKI